MKIIHLKCGHKIKVKTWPSRAGMAKMRRHYKKFHPARMKAMTKKSLATKRKRGLIKNKCKPNPKFVLIYDKLLGIEARKQHGKFKGESFRHDFKHDTDAVVMGNPDGSLTIRSKKGKRLWGKFNYD